MNRIVVISFAIWLTATATCRSADSPDLKSVSRQLDRTGREKDCVAIGLKPLPRCSDFEFLRRILAWILPGARRLVAEVTARSLPERKSTAKRLFAGLLKSPGIRTDTGDVSGSSILQIVVRLRPPSMTVDGCFNS